MNHLPYLWDYDIDKDTFAEILARLGRPRPA